MSNKFTEEQYQNIIECWEFGESYTESTIAVIAYVISQNIEVTCMGDEALALANPVTRELAYEKYVEEEKQYVWRLKNDNNMVISALIDGWFVDGVPAGKQYFTEEEINNSPFKPEWFDKEEVKLNVEIL